MNTEERMSARPLFNNLVVEELPDEEQTTAGGIIVPGSAKKRTQRCRVLAVGPGPRNEGADVARMTALVAAAIADLSRNINLAAQRIAQPENTDVAAELTKSIRVADILIKTALDSSIAISDTVPLPFEVGQILEKQPGAGVQASVGGDVWYQAHTNMWAAVEDEDMTDVTTGDNAVYSVYRTSCDYVPQDDDATPTTDS